MLWKRLISFVLTVAWLVLVPLYALAKDNENNVQVITEVKEVERIIAEESATEVSIENQYIRPSLLVPDQEMQRINALECGTEIEVQEISETQAVRVVEIEVEEVIEETKWEGEVLNRRNGTVKGPSGKETYYNLDMTGVIWIMEDLGYDYEYHVREDGVKMYGPYIMCAANLEIRPRGTLVETSLGLAMVCDTGSYAKIDPTWIDIAVTW